MRRSPFGAAWALAVLAAGSVRAQPPAPPPEPEPEVVGSPAAFGSDAVAEERVALPEGTALHELPDPRSPALTTIDATSELSVIERSGPWVRVRYGALVGWVLSDRPLPVDPAAAPHAPRSLVAGGELHDRALAAAAAWAGAAPASGRPRLGGWILFTDVDDPALVRFLDRVAASLAQVYRDRYALEPGTPEGEAVALFAREEDYREFAAENAGLLGIGEGGHAGHGVAALYAGSRDREEIAALLVHELTHLINARALGPRTPPWLEEGLANDLGFCEIGRGGRLQPGTVGGAQRRQVQVGIDGALEVKYSWEGAKGAMVGLRRSLDAEELASLETLLHLSWRELVDPGERSQLYAESTFFVRYLVAQAPDAFHGYLRGLVAGATGDPGPLLDALDADWAELDEGFGVWFLSRTEQLGLRHDGPPGT